jgi:hypothetical protein
MLENLDDHLEALANANQNLAVLFFKSGRTRDGETILSGSAAVPLQGHPRPLKRATVLITNVDFEAWEQHDRRLDPGCRQRPFGQSAIQVPPANAAATV